MPERTEVPKKILLEGEEFGLHEEYNANESIIPGHLIEVMSTSKVKKNAGASIPCRKLFALEEGQIGRTIDTPYVSTSGSGAGDVVRCHQALPGHLVNGFCPASATALVKGDKVKSNGDGTMVKITASTDFVIGLVEEAVDNSAGGSAARVKVRIN